jgi:hypothetical protein
MYIEQALGHWEFNRHAQKHMKRREDIPKVIYPKYLQKSSAYALHYTLVGGIREPQS